MKTILFDLDDTIFDFHKAETAAISKTLKELSIEPTPQVLARYSVLNLAQWKRLELGEIDRDEVKVGRFRNLFDELGVDASAKKAAKIYEKYLGIGHYFLPGALEMIQSLSNEYRLYLVSNGTACVQKGRIESSGIAVYFQKIFISEIVGYNKPDRRFFDACFAEIPDFSREETVIVGDSLSSDIQGGNGAGIKTIWFNPRHASLPEDSAQRPDAVYAAPEELEHVLCTVF